jgi:hypothetical protein
MKDTIRETFEVAGIGAGAIYAIGLDIEIALKILVSAASLGFIIYKWYKESRRV